MSYEELVSGIAASHGFAIKESLPVGNTRAATSQRQVFRLLLRDGSALKARVLEGEIVAEHVATLARLLPPEWSARCLAQTGRVILSEWVEGAVPPDPRKSHETMREIARLQARLHSLQLPATTSPHDCATIEKWQRLYAEWLERLRGQSLLTRDDCQRLLSASATPPPSARIVVSHGDLCRTNLVRTPAGALVLIDHKTLNLGPVEFDLARTIYRSHFDVEEACRYQAHYSEAPETPGYEADALGWWAPLVWAQSAQFRLAMEQPGWKRAVRLLRASAQGGDVDTWDE